MSRPMLQREKFLHLKPKWMRWSGHVVSVKETENMYTLLKNFVYKIQLGTHKHTVDVNKRITLNYIFKKDGVRLWIVFIRLIISSNAIINLPSTSRELQGD